MAQRSSSPRRSAVAGLAVNVGVNLPGFLVASLIVQMRDDFALSASALGIALALFYSVSAIFIAPIGRIVDAVGAIRGLYAACVLGAVSALGIALLAGSPVALTALLIPSALAKAAAAPGVASLMARDVPQERRGIAFGLQHSAPPIGMLLAGLALPLVALPLGWRWAFAANAVLLVASGLLLPRHGLLRRAAAARGEGPHPRGRDLRTVHVVALAAALASTAGIGMLSFLVVFAVSAGLGPAQAGALLALTSAVAVVSRLGLGALHDRRPSDLLMQVAVLLMVCSIGFLLLATETPALLVPGALIAGGVGWAWQALAGLAVVTDNPTAPAQAAGIQMTGFFVGAVVGPLLVSTIAAKAGFGPTWLVCAGLVLLASITAGLASRMQRPARVAPGPVR